MKNIIEIRNLTKKFGNFTAVDRINLNIREGEIFGFLGPNGAGKTTTISMLTTLIQPTSGTGNVAGHDIATEGVNVRTIIGVVPQLFSLFPELTAEENLAYIGKLYGMDAASIKQRSDYLLKTVVLYEHRDRIAGIFSGGMKQRLSLAAGIMSNPKILFMDEPTTGLDPQSRIAIRELTKLLQQGQSSPVTFTIGIDKDATPGTYGLDLLVDYEDAQGKKLQDTAKVSLTVIQKNIFRQVFMDYWFIWVIVLIAAAVILIRRAKAKKKKD